MPISSINGEPISLPIEANALAWKRYLVSTDVVTDLEIGVYGISSAAASKPSGLPSAFPSTQNGIIVAYDKASNIGHSLFYLCICGYSKRIWMYTGYGWFEVVTEKLLDSGMSGVYSYLYENLIPDLVEASKASHSVGDEIQTTKTQYRWLNKNGAISEIGDGYPLWYVATGAAVEPFTFYYVTGSARYANHAVYQILDGGGNVLAQKVADSATVLKSDNELIYTPVGAAQIRIASVEGADEAAVYAAVEKESQLEWSGKKWACIGDSLTAVNARTTMHYHDYIAESTGIEVVNLGAGGTGYKKEYGGEGPFIDRVGSIPPDSDVVTIFGSGNDGGYTIGEPTDTGTETLCGCINETIDAIFDRMTTCQLGIVTPCPWQSYNPSDDTNWMARYSAAIVEICRRRGIPCLDLYHCSNLRPWEADFRAAAYSKDDGGGVHPDETGHALLAPRFKAFLDSLVSVSG